jgi:hypothetical protein
MPSSTDTIAGYSGVTATGAGYTGTVPIATAPSTTASAANYDAALSDVPLTSAAKAYHATATQTVFTDDEAEVFVAPNESEFTRYAYEWDIGPTSALVTPQSAMAIIQSSPNVVFPFEVEGLQGERTLQIDRTYNLKNVRLPGDNGNPVLIVQQDATSFTFLTEPGHFRGAGRTIKFQTLDRDGRLVLRQEATSSATVVDELYDFGSRISWRYQADNLRAAIYGGERSDFPGSFPVSW